MIVIPTLYVIDVQIFPRGTTFSMFQDDRRGFFQPVGPVSLGRARNYSTAGVHSKPSLPRSLSLTNLFDTDSFSSRNRSLSRSFSRNRPD